jgi:hypothetical protein
LIFLGKTMNIAKTPSATLPPVNLSSGFIKSGDVVVGQLLADLLKFKAYKAALMDPEVNPLDGSIINSNPPD